ncbi:unnamed protein product, partial [Prorocentrum cordatum]
RALASEPESGCGRVRFRRCRTGAHHSAPASPPPGGAAAWPLGAWPPPWARRLDGMDEDEAERNELLQDIFQKLDRNHNGSLGFDELLKLCRCRDAADERAFHGIWDSVCREYGAPGRGLNFEQFLRYTSEESSSGHCFTEDLPAISRAIEEQLSQELQDMRRGELDRDCIIAGWLHKRGPNADYAWMRRYCRLRPGILEYFEDGTGETKKGDVELGPSSVAIEMRNPKAPGDAAKHKDRKCGFVLDPDPQGGAKRRLFYFDAAAAPDGLESEASESYLRAWIQGVKTAAGGVSGQSGAVGEWTFLVLRDAKVYKESCSSRGPTGLRLTAGSIQTIVERAANGPVTWLRLAEGQGWVEERSHQTLQLSEVFEEELPHRDDGLPFVIQPSRKFPVALQPYVFLPAGAQEKSNQGISFGSVDVHAGAIVKVLTKARVLMPVPKSTSEEWMQFLRIMDEAGHEGWIRYHSPSKEENVVTCQIASTGSDTAQSWVSVLPRKEPLPIYGLPGRSNVSAQILHSGEMAEVKQKLSTGDLNFFQLAKGGWICETDEKGKQALDVLEREPHEWIYVCQDKDGAAIKKHPTRCKQSGTGQYLKHRARGMVSEKITFTNGDVFLKLKPPSHEGWIPLAKKDGQPKMKALQALAPKAGGAQAPQMGPPMQPMRPQPQVMVFSAPPCSMGPAGGMMGPAGGMMGPMGGAAPGGMLGPSTGPPAGGMGMQSGMGMGGMGMGPPAGYPGMGMGMGMGAQQPMAPGFGQQPQQQVLHAHF